MFKILHGWNLQPIYWNRDFELAGDIFTVFKGLATLRSSRFAPSEARRYGYHLLRHATRNDLTSTSQYSIQQFKSITGE